MLRLYPTPTDGIQRWPRRAAGGRRGDPQTTGAASRGRQAEATAGDTRGERDGGSLRGGAQG